MMVFQRKQVVVLSLVLVLLIAGYLQYTYNGDYRNWGEVSTMDKKPGEPTYVENSKQTFSGQTTGFFTPPSSS